MLVAPGPGGGHNWFPMAYSPRTKLAYFPAYQSEFVYALQPDWKPQPFRSNSGWGGFTGEAGKKRAELMEQAGKIEKTWLTAWDPVKQEAAWKVELPRHGNGGVFVTASDLVFEGTTKQTFAAFDAQDRQSAVGISDAERAGGRRDHLYARRRAIRRDQRRLGRRCGADRARRRHRTAARSGAVAGVQAGRGEATAAARQGRSDPQPAAGARHRGDRSRRARSCSPRPARYATARTPSAGSRTCAT